MLFVITRHSAFGICSDPMLRLRKSYFGDGMLGILYKPFEIDKLYTKSYLLTLIESPTLTAIP
jgi:hypothetical protein